MPTAAGVRRALDKQVDRAIGSRVNEGAYLALLCTTSAVSWVLLRIGRHLSR